MTLNTGGSTAPTSTSAIVTAYRNIRWCEDVLIRSGAFTLPGKQALITTERAYKIVLIDATETPLERPPKEQRRYYSGKKMPHAEDASRRRHGDGQDHLCDPLRGSPARLSLVQRVRVRLHSATEALTDTGYLGRHKLHGKTIMPQNRSKKYPLVGATSTATVQFPKSASRWNTSSPPSNASKLSLTDTETAENASSFASP